MSHTLHYAHTEGHFFCFGKEKERKTPGRAGVVDVTCLARLTFCASLHPLS